MVKILSTTPTAQTLKQIYDVCNEIFKDESLFYSSKEVNELKKSIFFTIW